MNRYKLPSNASLIPENLVKEIMKQNKANFSFVDFIWDNKIKLSIGFYLLFLITYTIFAASGLLPASLQAEPEKVANSYKTMSMAEMNNFPANISPISTTSNISSTTNNSSSSDISKKTNEISSVKFSTSTLPKIKTSSKKTLSKAIKSTPKVAVDSQATNPIRVVIDKIGVDVKVSNPKGSDSDTLDAYLKKGAVRYPGSAGLGNGNTFIFAHSTNHPVVINQAYKAFNGFSSLSNGDVIKVYTINKEYTYVVDNVRLADADQVFVDLSTDKNMITLSTCNTFGEKQERYVVEASFAGSRSI